MLLPRWGVVDPGNEPYCDCQKHNGGACSLSFQFISLVLIFLVCQQASCAYTLQQMDKAGAAGYESTDLWMSSKIEMEMTVKQDLELPRRVSVVQFSRVNEFAV